MVIKDDDFVLINFVGRVVQTGKIFDLTYKDIAEKEGIKQESFNFAPILVIPNSRYVLPAVSKSLVGRNLGDKYSLDVKASEGFGDFNSKLVKTVGLSTFIQSGVNPQQGDVVSLDGKLATVLSAGGGRVLVNLNHPLAGKDLKYDIEVVKVLDNDSEKCGAVFEHYTGKKPDSTKIEERSVILTYGGEKLQKYVIDAIVADINKYINKEYKVEISKT